MYRLIRSERSEPTERDLYKWIGTDVNKDIKGLTYLSVSDYSCKLIYS